MFSKKQLVVLWITVIFISICLIEISILSTMDLKRVMSKSSIFRLGLGWRMYTGPVRAINWIGIVAIIAIIGAVIVLSLFPRKSRN